MYDDELKGTGDNEVMDWVIPYGEGRAYVTMLEMVLPQALFEATPKSLTIDWIDFYR